MRRIVYVLMYFFSSYDMQVGDLDEVDERTSGLLISTDPSHAWLTMPQEKILDLQLEVVGC